MKNGVYHTTAPVFCPVLDKATGARSPSPEVGNYLSHEKGTRHLMVVSDHPFCRPSAEMRVFRVVRPRDGHGYAICDIECDREPQWPEGTRVRCAQPGTIGIGDFPLAPPGFGDKSLGYYVGDNTIHWVGAADLLDHRDIWKGLMHPGHLRFEPHYKFPSQPDREHVPSEQMRMWFADGRWNFSTTAPLEISRELELSDKELERMATALAERIHRKTYRLEQTAERTKLYLGDQLIFDRSNLVQPFDLLLNQVYETITMPQLIELTNDGPTATTVNAARLHAAVAEVVAGYQAVAVDAVIERLRRNFRVRSGVWFSRVLYTLIGAAIIVASWLVTQVLP